MTNNRTPLSNDARTALKKAISAHPDCKTALTAHGLTTTANALIPQIWDMADMLAIDASPIIAGADLAAATPGPAPHPVANVTVAAALDAMAALGIAPANVTPATDTAPASVEINVKATPPAALEAVMSELDLFLRPDMSARLKAGIADLAANAEAAKANAEAAKANAEAANAARVAAERQARVMVPASTAKAATRGAMSTLGVVFGIRGKWAKVPCQTWTPCKDTPPVDPDYIFDAETLGLVVTAIDSGTGVWAHGPKGSGKTELAIQIAARTGRPLTRIGLAADQDKYAMLGLRAPDDKGAFVWSDGILTQAYRTPGCLVLLDEPTFAAPGLLAVIQTSADVRKISLEDTGEKVPFADGVALMCCDNTDGHGDDGAYAGTQPMNTAFLDRFPVKVRMDTPDKGTIARILTARTGLPNAAALMLAQIVKDSETLAAKSGLSSHLSIRPMLAFSRAAVAGLPLEACFGATVMSALPAAEATVLRQHIGAHFSIEALENILNPNAGGMTPAGQSAMHDFSTT